MRMTKSKTLNIFLSLMLVLGLMPLATGQAFADDEIKQSDQNEYMWYGYKVYPDSPDVVPYDRCGFDVAGVVRNTQMRSAFDGLMSTFDGLGYLTKMTVGDQYVFAAAVKYEDSSFDYTESEADAFEYGKEYVADNVKLSITPELEGHAVLMHYHITNMNSSEKEVKVGTFADVQVEIDEKARIGLFRKKGMIMTGRSNGYSLAVLPAYGGQFTTKWYGELSYTLMNHVTAEPDIFYENLSDTKTLTNVNSALAYSWTVTVPANKTVTKTAAFLIGNTDVVSSEAEKASHAHVFEYSELGDTVKATCTAEDCYLPAVGGHHVASLTIAPPNNLAFTGGQKPAYLSGDTSVLGTPEITYYATDEWGTDKVGEPLSTPPVSIGTYWAEVTIGEGDNTATAHVIYSITKADPIANPPSGLSVDYGKTLADVILENPAGNTEGTWSWVKPLSTSVGNAGQHTFKANFTPTDSDIYNDVKNIDVNVVVNKIPAPQQICNASTTINANQGNTAVIDYRLPAGAQFGNVTNGAEGFLTVNTDNGIVLTADRDWVENEWAVDDTKSVSIEVNNATNYENYNLLVEVTPTYKQVPTITAEDTSISFGDTNQAINATTSSGGVLTYEVVSGTAVDVDEESGVLTPLGVGTATVRVTSAETEDFTTGTKDVVVTVTPKSIEGVTVTGIENKTYTGSDIAQTLDIEDGDYTLVENTDYTVSYQNNKVPGTAKVIISGMGNYSGSIEREFTISAKGIADVTVTGLENKTYTGSDITQTLVIEDEDEDYTLIENTDYTLSYQNNINPGTAKVIITGKDGYSGSIEREFTISPKSIEGVTVTGLENKTYTGSDITQTPVVKDGDNTLVENTDYTVSYQDNIMPGTAKVIITGKGCYSGSVEKTFTISAKSIEGVTITGLENKTYTGSDIAQTLVVKDGDYTLVENTDYTVSYQNNKMPGTAKVIITGEEGYSGSVEREFTISAKSIEGVTVSGLENKHVTGSAITQTLVIKDGDYTLIENTDYTLSYQNNINPGTAKVIITGKDGYSGSIEREFTIAEKSIEGVTVTGLEDKTYTGSAITQTLHITEGNYALIENTDYELEYENNIEPGNATVIIKGIGSYGDTLRKTFKINPKGIDGVNIAGVQDNVIYTGSAIVQTLQLTDGNYALVENTDYEITYTNNIEPGQATAVIKGLGRYGGTTQVSFTIIPKSIDGVVVSGVVDKKYVGTAITQTPHITDGNYALQEGVDYTLGYENNINPGIATVTISGQGRYTGSISRNFTISEKSISELTVSGIVDKAYTGKPVTQSPVVKNGDYVLKENVDYTVRYENNINPGTATLIIEGKGGYTGSITKTFTITSAVKPSKPVINVQPVKKTTINEGTTKPFSISVKAKAVRGGKLSYQWYSNGKPIKGATKATYTIKNPSALKPGSYNFYCMVSEQWSGGKTTNKSAVSTLTILAPLSFVQMTPQGKTALTLTWNKENAADGYDVFFSRCNHDGIILKCKKIKTIKGNKTTTYTKPKLLANTCYKAYVKPFKMVGGKKVYLATSPQVHGFTNGGNQKYSNPKKIALSKTKASIKAKQSFQLKAKVTIGDLKKKIISEGHASVVRYISSDTSVAKVGKTGKVVGVEKGTATIYAITQNGLRAACKVTVN